MPNKIAIDIALLLPEAIAGLMIQLNKQLAIGHDSPIRFGAGGSLPHITLAMACVNHSDIEAINAILTSMVRQSAPLPLQLQSFSSDEELPTGERVYSFSVQNTAEMQTLQQGVLRELDPFFSHELTREMLFRSNEVSDETFAWMQQYIRDFPLAAFHPHITVGIGTVESSVTLPLPFIASTLAVCHLGNNCTCNTVLGSHAL